MSDRQSGGGGNRLSPQTLIVASLASLTAAIVTSTFWQKGTPITAAITPVIVALASELYSRPARRISEFGSRAATRTRPARQAPVLERERVRVGAPPREERPPITEPGGAGPIRVYRAERAPRRRIHPKVVLVTAAIAFAIALVALTVPELVLGGAAASSSNTTFFGGGGHAKKHNPAKQNDTTPSHTQTTPQATTPQTTTTTPVAPPAQTTPQATQPSAPSPAPAPSATTPAQTPPGQ